MQERGSATRSRRGYATAEAMTAQQRIERARKGALTSSVNTVIRRAADLTEEQRAEIRQAISQI